MKWISQVITVVLCVGNHQQIFTPEGIAIMSRACALVWNHLCLQMAVLAPSPMHLPHIILIPKSYSLLIPTGCLERAHEFTCNCSPSDNTISLCQNLPLAYVYWTVHHLDSWVKRDQLDATCFIITLFSAQHVSNVNTSILRSLRLICWVISWVVLLWFDVCWCYVVVWLWFKPQRNTNTHRTRAIQHMK